MKEKVHFEVKKVYCVHACLSVSLYCVSKLLK